MNVLAVMDARSAHDQLSRVKKAACTSLETLKEVKNMIKKVKDMIKKGLELDEDEEAFAEEHELWK